MRQDEWNLLPRIIAQVGAKLIIFRDPMQDTIFELGE
jgi:hypothetical protein